jgi:DNA excision repair protein ERCC-4
VSKCKTQPTSVQCPFRIVVDTREQLPYTFAGLTSDAKAGRLPIAVETITGTIESGDYTIEGMANRVAVERKSKADLFGTIGKGRERFQRELARLNELEFAIVVVEAEWVEIFRYPPVRSKLTPKTIFRSVNAWEQRYTRVHWCFCPGRPFAEAKTFRVLERFWNVAMRAKHDHE